MIAARRMKGIAGSAPSRRVKSKQHIHIPLPSLLSPYCRSSSLFSSSSSDDDESTILEAKRTTGIRLYRILQRQCRQLEAELREKGQSQFLFQSPLDPHQAGSSRMFAHHHHYTQQGSPPPKQQTDLFELFTHWSETRFGVGERYWEQEEESVAADPEGFFLDEWCRQLVRATTQKHQSRSENDAEQHDSDDDDDLETRNSVWTDVPTMQDTIRTAYRHHCHLTHVTIPHAPDHAPHASSSALLWIKYQHQWAIRAYQILQEQRQILRLSSTSLDDQHAVQVTAFSKCIGRSLSRPPRRHRRPQQPQQQLQQPLSSLSTKTTTTTSSNKYRFAYRIRIENRHDTDTFQLLGRTWYIVQDDNHDDDNSSSGDHENHEETRPILRVHAPDTGAVGQFPVLPPGQAFEYTSGAEVTSSGHMRGCFYLAPVPRKTPSATVGMRVPALEESSQSDQQFAVTVQPFPLQVEAGVPFWQGP